MNSADLIEIIGNLSRSLVPVQHLLFGLAYLLGLVFFIIAMQKLRKMSESSSHDGSFVSIAYLLGASALFFLPSAMQTLSNTVFGMGNNVLQYSDYQPYNIQSSMTLVIRTAGIIWFIRGCVLLTQSSEPGVQHGPKGLTFLIAGIFAMNFESTIAFLTWFLNQITSLTLSVKSNQGY